MIGIESTTEPRPMQTLPELATTVPTYDSQLCAIIRRDESNDNPFALRFERKVFNNVTNDGKITPVLARIMEIHHCSGDTARMIYSTSWGAFQIMGFNLYNSRFGYTGTIASFLNDTDAQGDLYALFLQEDGINWKWNDIKSDETKLAQFAIKYNGSTDYVANMQQAAKELGLL
jgi:hypothetical protein